MKFLRLSTPATVILIHLSTVASVRPVIAGTDAAATHELPPAAVQAESDANAFERLWSLATLYKDDANPFIQEFKLRGRYHGQYHWLDSEQGDSNAWEDRRSRFGFDARFFDKKFEVRLDAQSTDRFDPFYGGLVDAYLKWKPSSAFSLTLGKQKPRIGHYDWLQSTNAQPTFERSQIFNQLRVDRAPGAVAEGTVGRFSYDLGAYSNDVDREFGQFDGGFSFGGGVGWDFKESLDVDRADLRLHWLHSDHQEADTVLNRYDNLFSTTFWIEQDRAGFVAEAFAGTGTSSDVFGFFLQPTYDLRPGRLQLVGRYSFAHGDGADSVIAQSRYERTAPNLTGGGRGETYHAGYLGLQFFLHGDNLKLMSGVEYARLDGGGNGGDFGGWTVLSGVRLSF
jgi:hypothetical protein